MDSSFITFVHLWLHGLQRQDILLISFLPTGTVLTIGGLWYLFKDDMLRFSLYFWLSYLFDCLDGYFARRYNMVTAYGDIFEHTRDVLSLLIMMIICIYNYTISKPVILITIISSGLTGIHVGCVQDRFVNRDYKETLDFFKFLCMKGELSELALCYGVGMYMATLYLVILYLSGGIWLFTKLTGLSVISLYFIGLYYKRCYKTFYEREQQREEIVAIPQELLQQ